MQPIFKSGSEAETARFAAGFAKLLQPGDIILLKGQLGAGKTFFVRAAARALGVTVPVTSPSFTMANSYCGDIAIHHLDLYRLPAFDSQAEADFADFFEADAVTFIEWPEVAEHYLPEIDYRIELEHDGEHTRRLIISASSREMQSELEALIDRVGH